VRKPNKGKAVDLYYSRQLRDIRVHCMAAWLSGSALVPINARALFDWNG